MRASLTMVAAFVTIAGPTLAEPAKRDATKPAVQQRPTEVVLASADPAQGSTTVGAQPASTPVKRPMPRVTSCRCGDPQTDAGAQEQ